MSKFLEKIVESKAWGRGTIVEVSSDDKIFVVDFKGEKKTLAYPESFLGDAIKFKSKKLQEEANKKALKSDESRKEKIAKIAEEIKPNSVSEKTPFNDKHRCFVVYQSTDDGTFGKCSTFLPEKNKGIICSKENDDISNLKFGDFVFSIDQYGINALLKVTDATRYRNDLSIAEIEACGKIEECTDSETNENLETKLYGYVAECEYIVFDKDKTVNPRKKIHRQAIRKYTDEAVGPEKQYTNHFWKSTTRYKHNNRLFTIDPELAAHFIKYLCAVNPDLENKIMDTIALSAKKSPKADVIALDLILKGM